MLRFFILTTCLAALAAANPVPELIVAERDTIGGTTYDWQQSGPAIQTVVNDPTYGIHATWMYSAATGPYPDRNKRYNFYDNLAGSWNFIDPTNYMNSGVNSFIGSTGYGSIDVDPASGCAVISAHYSTYPSALKDAAPGAGIFTECAGPPNCSLYVWPVSGITSDGKIHNALIDASTRSMVYYSRVDPWCTWSVPYYISTPPGINPTYPSHNLAVAHASDEVIVSWTDPLEDNVELFLRQSTDGGLSWNDPYSLPPPPAFTPGSDTTAQYDLTGAYVAFDRSDDWHLVTTVIPQVAGITYVMPAEIWHYCPTQTPQWSRVRRAECDTLHLAGSLGYAAVYACRPSLAFGQNNRCFVVWEEFDSSNVEPATGLLRADIMSALSQNNGRSWWPESGSPLTLPDGTSKRFPFVAWNANNDTMHIVYEQDLQAGFPIKGEGTATDNLIVYVRAVWMGSGVAERPAAAGGAKQFSVTPNPFRDRVTFSAGSVGSARLVVSDAAGRSVRELTLGGRVVWDGRNSAGARLPAGVYFYTLTSGPSTVRGKLLMTE
jgi:hypothetical protein